MRTRFFILLAMTTACAGTAQRSADPWTRAPASEPMAADAIAGSWLTDAGEVFIESARDGVRGQWTSGGGPTASQGRFVGRLEGNVLHIEWREQHGTRERAGRGYLVFTTDGTAFYGRWWSPDATARGEWTGWRPGATTIGSAAPAAHEEHGHDRDIEDARPPRKGRFGAGTCFAVSPDGHVATAAHVIDGARKVWVHFPAANTRHLATIVKRDPEVDLALLRVARTGAEYLPLSKQWSRLGEKVFTIGFPYTFDLGAEPKFSEGVLSSRSVSGIKGLMQVSMPIQPGNSGGPLVDHRGEVVGVVFARADDLKFLERTGSLPQNVAFAVAAGFLRPMIPTPRDRPPTATREAAIDRTEAAVCSVLVER